jgi:hypothetical protein
VKILRAIGGIDDELIERAAPKENAARAVVCAPWLKWAVPVAACLILSAAAAMSILRNVSPSGDRNVNSGSGIAEGNNEADGASAENSAINDARPEAGASWPKPGLTIESGNVGEACYVVPDEWRGLATDDFVLREQTDGISADRMVFQTLAELADYADAFAVVPKVHQTAQDGTTMQTAIAEYSETIGDMLITAQWDDYTVSTGGRILIRQRLISGCSMSEPNNLLREGGVYLLPVKFSADAGAYEVVGDFDVLFELDDEGKIVSHSRFPAFNRYDGTLFSELLNAVHALYPVPDASFIEQPIVSVEQAESQVNTAYICYGFRKFLVKFVREAVIRGADVYLFRVALGADGLNGSEYAAIAKENGAFIRGTMDANGELQIAGGMGAFPAANKR